MRMPSNMRTVNDRARMTGLMTGPGHPAARKMAKSIENEGTDPGMTSGPPNFRDAEQADGPESEFEGESCASCRDFLAGDDDDSGKCNRYGVPARETKVCDAFAAEEAPDSDYEEDEPEEMMA